MAHDVFISYSTEDKPVADAVCAALETRHVRCWIAPRDVLPGREYAEMIVEGIREAGLMVLVYSSHSNRSPHVMREVERAASRGIPILPFRIEDVAMSAAMEYYISSTHWLDALSPPLEKHLDHLAETVKLLLARTGWSTPAEASQAAPADEALVADAAPSSPTDAASQPAAAKEPAKTTRKTKQPAPARYKTWSRLKPTGAVPSPRFEHAMACDPVSGRVILFGGTDGQGGALGDTWLYDPTTGAWTDLRPGGAVPPPRGCHALVYDSRRACAILFGGRNEAAGQHFNETWAYDPAANRWTDLAPRRTSLIWGAAPAKRRDHAMVYDPDTGRVILFGGGNNRWIDNETWAYAPETNTWSELDPRGTRPARRYGHSMAYAQGTGKIVLFGGAGNKGVDLGDTWLYQCETNTWTEVVKGADAGPGPCAFASAAYDRLNGRMVLYGGLRGDTAYDETWAYDMATDRWAKVDRRYGEPPGRTGHALVWDEAGKRVLLFGGWRGGGALNDFWACMVAPAEKAARPRSSAKDA